MPFPNLPPPTSNGLSTLGALLRDLGGRTGGTNVRETLDRIKAEQEQARQQAEFQARLDSMNLDPRERMAMELDPKAWAGQVSQNYGPATVAGGQTRYYGDGHAVTAPLLTESAGVYGTQTPDAYTQTGQRAPSYGEITDAAKADETARHQQYSDLTAGLPTGFHPEIGPDGQPTGKWLIDPGYRDFKLEDSSRGATHVTTNVQLPAQNAFAEAFGKQYASDLSGAREQATKSQRTLDSLKNAQRLLDSGDVLTGAAAPAALGVLRGLAVAGNKDAQRKVAATQEFENSTKRQVLDIIKELGSGSAISDADRKFTEQIVGGNIALDANALRRIIQIQTGVAQGQVDRADQMGREAYQSVPSAQGLPPSAFPGMGANNHASPPPTVRRYNPATGRVE